MCRPATLDTLDNCSLAPPVTIDHIPRPISHATTATIVGATTTTIVDHYLATQPPIVATIGFLRKVAAPRPARQSTLIKNKNN